MPFVKTLYGPECVCASVSASAPVSECIKYVYVMENFPREIFGKVRLLWRSET